jgi:hypothetical protein
MTTLRLGLIVLSFFTTTLAVPLMAQRVRGEVLRGDGSTPAAGIVVVATGANGAVAARGLSGSAGTFDLRLPAAGRYTLSALRIGYRPTVVDGVIVADTGTTSLKIVLDGAAISLAEVKVRTADVCGSSDDPQTSVVQVWSEARTALMSAALWSREPLDAEWIMYRRELRPVTEDVRSQEVRTRRGATTHAFVSRAADSLAALGYVLTDAAGSMYYAPDPDVLLSDSFADTHCFHLEPPPADAPGLVGVGFGPQRSRGDRVEIAGTLWIDRASSELRWLEYRYVGLPGLAEEAKPGGRVEFLRLAEGPWMVSRWYIRMPQVGPPDRNDQGSQVTMLKGRGEVLRGIGITGGMVSSVRRRGQGLYTAEGAAVALQMVRSDSAVSVALPLVKLEGTDYEWRGDSSGRVRAAPVLEGRYIARIATAEMLALGAPPVVKELQVSADRARVDSVRVPTAREIVRGACGADAAKNGLAALYGTVRDSSARPAEGRAVTVSWLGPVSGLSAGRVFSGRTTTGTLSDDAGDWRLCDVPRERALTVRTAGDDGQASVEVTVPEWRWFVNVPLRVRATAVAAAGDADASSASLELLVRDKTGVVDAAALELKALTGEQRKVTTDARGRALVAAFPPGIVKMRARRAGYAPGDLVFAVAPGRNTVPVILDKVAMPRLDTVRVIGNRKGSSKLDGFETRRARREATVSYTREEIQKRLPVEVSDLLRGVGAIRLVDSSGVMMAQLSRGFTLDRDANAKPCNMRVMLDGMMMPEGAGVNVVRPVEVSGLEVFASTARTPVGLAIMPMDAACGLIAIWTGR